MQDPIFIVGTGRCGSTMLSRMLNRNPGVLSLSEFFTLLKPRIFTCQSADGPAMWQLLNTPPQTLVTLLRHGLSPLSGEAVPFPVDRIPPLLTTLAHIVGRPAAVELYREVGPVVKAWPEGPPRDHCLRLFEWLKERFRRRLWVERSGGSLAYLPWLISAFPNARFVHLFRDGRECALSMSNFHYFRLEFLGNVLSEKAGYNPYESQDLLMDMREEVKEFFGDAPFNPWDILTRFQLPDNWRALMPESFEAETFRNTPVPPHLFGAIWSAMIIRGLIHLTRLPPGRVLTLRYDEVMASPETELQRLIDFLQPELSQPEWLAAAADQVQVKAPGWLKLPEEEKRLLELTCGPGMRMMRQLARLC